ncbi:outer membrane protein transport protein [uncultured Photobacterium sp.]|uniref:outer membrane protein transport protein n=1 Tax=uncultured Photobacterium sp. TaxID=173973 RepID=UPI0026278BA2|nr:outer membrane protein transport protein [uncultured Photobacterium sp.]
MFKKRLLPSSVISAIIFSSASTQGAGFQLNSQSATGLGRAFAGDAVIADNASVAARNPAAMALFKENSVSLGFNVISTDVSIKEGTYNQPRIITNGNEILAVETNQYDISGTDDIGGSSFVPNLHLIVPLNDQWAWGVSLYSNFGTETEFDNDFAASIFGGKTSVKSMNLGTSLSYRLSQNLSFGAGIDLIYGMGDLKRDFDTEACMAIGGKPALCRDIQMNVIDVEASGFALGWNAGIVYEINENHRFGLSYRYSPTVNAKGDVKAGTNEADSMDLPLPDIAEVSGYHRLTDKFAAHYSLQWVEWSAFDTLHIAGIDKEYQWKDAGHISIGGTYFLNNDWTLRAGYMYDISATDELKSISIPDSNRHWFSTGFTYQLNKKENIDFGFTYLMGENVTFDEQLNDNLPAPSISGATTRADAILVGLQYSRTF